MSRSFTIYRPQAHTPAFVDDIRNYRQFNRLADNKRLVHNHPSGDPTPSRADIEMTREVMQAAALLGVQLHDHLIIGRGGRHASLRTLGHL